MIVLVLYVYEYTCTYSTSRCLYTGTVFHLLAMLHCKSNLICTHYKVVVVVLVELVVVVVVMVKLVSI